MLEEKTQDLMINIRGLLPLIVSNALTWRPIRGCSLTRGPSVLLDQSGDHSAIEIVVIFHTAADEVAAVKSDLIKAVHTALDVPADNQLLAGQRRQRPRGDGSMGAPEPS